MKFHIKQIFIIVTMSILILGLITCSSAYTGTGFSHDIPYYKYSDVTSEDILQKYNDITCQKEFTGLCTGVVDGDTIFVEGIGKIRFVGVNTPERGVQGYLTSKYFVEKLCLDKTISLDVDDSKKNDRYGRTLAVVIVENKNLNEILLKESLAEIMYMPPSEFFPYDWTSKTTKVSNNKKTSTNVTKLSNSFSENTNSKDITIGKYVASANSDKFHKNTCRFAKNIKDNNKLSFKSRSDAIKQGYSPCKLCNP